MFGRWLARRSIKKRLREIDKLIESIRTSPARVMSREEEKATDTQKLKVFLNGKWNTIKLEEDYQMAWNVGDKVLYGGEEYTIEAPVYDPEKESVVIKRVEPDGRVVHLAVYTENLTKVEPKTKFKVGDIVTPNAEADKFYNVTTTTNKCKAWKVTELREAYGEGSFIRIEDAVNRSGVDFLVLDTCFDLYKETKFKVGDVVRSPKNQFRPGATVREVTVDGRYVLTYSNGSAGWTAFEEDELELLAGAGDRFVDTEECYGGTGLVIKVLNEYREIEVLLPTGDILLYRK